EVRAALLDLQRRLAAGGGIVAEGRDTGTVVFPDADLKVFLDAQPVTRAHRRWQEERARGHQVDYETTLSELQARDARDSTRAIAPLRAAPDAVMIDTSSMTLDEVVQRLLDEVAKRERH